MGLRYAGLGLVAWANLLSAAGTNRAVAQGGNVLIVVADDLGVDMLDCYGEGSVFPPTPTIDMLRDNGVLFRNAWANPVCSPTRATIMTGRYSIRTGVGTTVGQYTENGLPFEETIIPEMLDLNPQLGYQHAAIGKWHLTTDAQGAGEAPNLAGFSHFSGTLYNLTAPGVDYFNWPKTENGHTITSQVYATTDNVNEAVEWINAQGENPWFLYLAFNAPHNPLHEPPEELHTYDLPEDPSSLQLYLAMVEALDTELGRLFASIPESVFESTSVIFLGDNGTPGLVTEPPFDPDHAKLTLYDGGTNVPLIISGPLVASPGKESGVLVNTTDLFATALEMMGVDVAATLPVGVYLDSRSVLAILENQPFEPREFAYAEIFNDGEPKAGHGRTIRNALGFKLIRFTLEPEEFYDLSVDPFETNNLLLGSLDAIQEANYDELALEIDRLINSVCAGDANRDGLIDPLDVGFVQARFSCAVGAGDMECDAADQNGDGWVDPLDIGFVMANFGVCD